MDWNKFVYGLLIGAIITISLLIIVTPKYECVDGDIPSQIRLNPTLVDACCRDWAEKEGIITIQCVGEWVADDEGRCAFRCLETNTIGGEVDEFGCLVAAGYSWNSTEDACVREWIESGSPDRYQYLTESLANELAQSYMTDLVRDLYYGVQGFREISRHIDEGCKGCYDFSYYFIDANNPCGYETHLSFRGSSESLAVSVTRLDCDLDLSLCKVKACPQVSGVSCDILTGLNVCGQIIWRSNSSGICFLADEYLTKSELDIPYFQSAEFWCDN